MSSFLDLLNGPLPSASVMTEGFSDEDEEAVRLASSLTADAPSQMPEDDDDDTEEVELSPEEDAEADSIINLAATPIVLKEELTPSEVKEFAESEEYSIAVDEGFAFESADETFACTVGDIFVATEAAKFSNKNIVRFTKEARTNQLFEVCVQACARAKNDPMYWKLHKVQELRRKIKAVLRVRYKGPAMKKAKEYLIRLRQSKSPTMAKAASKLMGR